jgi:hypothetical protein
VRGYFGGRRSVGRPKGKLKKNVCTDIIHLLQIRNLKAATQREKFGNRVSGRPRSENGPKFL